MQFSSKVKPPVGVIYDSDLGSTMDTTLALALLYGFDQKNDLRVSALSVTKPNLKAAQYADLLGRFFGGAFGRSLPIGLVTEGKQPEDTPMMLAPLSKTNAEGKPAYAQTIQKMTDTADPAPLIRNALTAHHDQNCMIVLAGPATNLVQAMALHGTKELIAQKVRVLVVAAGSYPDGGAEPHIQADLAAARKLFAEWPTPIVAVGVETGQAVLFPGESIEKDYGWAKTHPVVDAYRANHAMPYDAPTHAMAAALYAARPQEGYFKVSDPGVIRVGDDGRTRFTAAPDGKHRYLIVDPAQKERIVKTYTEVASIKPVPRIPRFLQMQDKKKDEKEEKDEKPAEAKPKE